MQEPFDVAVIGGGFSGCAVAAQLARRAGRGLSLCLVEPDELGRGAAYGTQHAEHVLNTRARSMSLFADDPEHFVRWLGARGGPNDFLSRRLYGQYVAETARVAFESAAFTVRNDRVRRAWRYEGGPFVIEVGGGVRLSALNLVIATGNVPPNDEFLPRAMVAHPRYVANPWRFDYREIAGEVLVIGSGLTALDVLVALDASGYRGDIQVLSRRGRYPEVHATVAPYDVVPALDTSDARAALRSFRRQLREAARRGFDWRAVVDAVRPEGEAIWKRLSPLEQRRFERHVRAHWERHRHRAPQQVDAVRERLARAGRLTTYAGRVRGMERGTVAIDLAHGGTAQLQPDWIVNCTGLGRSARFAANPVLAGMLADGTISVEPGRLGLRVNNALNAIDGNGKPVDGLWIVGPLVRGSRFEATAVPELRAMADLAAGHIVSTLESAGENESARAVTVPG